MNPSTTSVRKQTIKTELHTQNKSGEFIDALLKDLMTINRKIIQKEMALNQAIPKNRLVILNLQNLVGIYLVLEGTMNKDFCHWVL